jgi:hypothetical protein
MRIAVEGIPAAGRDVPLGLRQSWATDAATSALDMRPDRLDGLITLQRATGKGVIRVSVRATAAVESSCDRCGEGCTLSPEVDTVLLYAPTESEGRAFETNEPMTNAATKKPEPSRMSHPWHRVVRSAAAVVPPGVSLVEPSDLHPCGTKGPVCASRVSPRRAQRVPRIRSQASQSACSTRDSTPSSRSRRRLSSFSAS